MWKLSTNQRTKSIVKKKTMCLWCIDTVIWCLTFYKAWWLVSGVGYHILLYHDNLSPVTRRYFKGCWNLILLMIVLQACTIFAPKTKYQTIHVFDPNLNWQGLWDANISSAIQSVIICPCLSYKSTPDYISSWVTFVKQKLNEP